MQEITMNLGTGRSFKEVFEEFVISKTAQGVSEATLDNYNYHMRNIARYFDIEQSFDEVRKKDIENTSSQTLSVSYPNASPQYCCPSSRMIFRLLTMCTPPL